MILVKLGITLGVLGIVMFPVSYLIETLTPFDADKLFLSGLILATVGASLLAISVILIILQYPFKPLYTGEC